MRQLARLSLAVGGLSLALPALAIAQNPAPPPYVAPAQQPLALEPAPAPQPGPVLEAPPAIDPAPAAAAPGGPVYAPVSAPAQAIPAGKMVNGEYTVPTGVMVSPKDAPAVEAQLRKLGPPQVVSETVIIDGKAVPYNGQTIMLGSSGSAPGRAVATDAPAGYATVASGEPEPIGVMRTGYGMQPGAMQPGMMSPAQMGRPGSSPYNPMMGRHGVPVPASIGSAPFLPSSPTPKPHVFAHLFGLDGITNAMRDRREARAEARKRREILQMYTESGRVDEVPAEAVYGKKAR